MVYPNHAKVFLLVLGFVNTGNFDTINVSPPKLIFEILTCPKMALDY